MAPTWSASRITHHPSPVTGGELALLALVLVVAASLRFYRLDQAPPGLNVDEAVDAMDAQHILGGWLPVFLPDNYGREALFIYLMAGSMALLGPTAVALRATAALVGMATVGLTWLVGRRWFGPWVGLLGAAGVATSFWHVDLSRVALRGISAPLFIGLAIDALWVALAGGRRRDFALAGLWAGLSQYTYISARFLGPLIVLLLALEFARRPHALWALRRALALYVAVGVAVFAPLGAYYVQHWDVVFLRSAQVSIFNPHPEVEFRVETPPEAVLRTLGMFFVRGDDAWRHNLSGRPVFQPPMAFLFLLGLGWVARRALRHQASPGPPSPGRWLLAWWAVEQLPGMLAHEAPNFLRETAIIPPTYLLPAIGLAWATDWLATRWRWAPRLGLALALLVAGGDAVSTARAYFGDWAHRLETYRFFDGPATDAAAFLNGLDTASLAGCRPMPETCSAPVTRHPPPANLVFWWDRSATIWFLAPRYRTGQWVREYTSVLPLPRDRSRDAVYLYAYSALPAALLRYFPNAKLVARHDGPGGAPAYAAYRVGQRALDAALRPDHPLEVGFGGEVELLGYWLERAGGRVQPGGTVEATLLWRVLADNQHNYGVFLHLDDEAGRRWGQQDLQGFMAEGWHAGDLFLSRHTIPIPGDAPAMVYHLLAGVEYRTVKGQPSRSLEPLGERLQLAEVAVDPGVAPAPSPARALERELTPGLLLRGFRLDRDGAQAGDGLGLDLLWQASTALPDLEVSVELRDGGGWAWWRVGPRAPAYGRFPTVRWLPGETVLDPYKVELPPNLPSGTYRLVARAWQGGAVVGEQALASVKVEGRERNFAPPHPQHPLAATFGDQVELLGYDLDHPAVQVGSSLHLTLYWRALRAPDQGYTVFTHLLDGHNRVVGQHDGQPRDGAYPTSLWAPGEVVQDDYDVPLNEPGDGGPFQIEVGLYDASSGRRLPVSRHGRPDGDRVLLARIDRSGR